MRSRLGLAMVVACALTAAAIHGVDTAAAAGTRTAAAPCLTPPSGMVAWYPFDEAGGPTAAELVAGNTGAKVGGPLSLGGKIDRALAFTGAGTYVQAPDTPQINFPANFGFSIDAWVRMTRNSITPLWTLVDKRDPSSLIGYRFFISSDQLGIELSGTSYLSPSIPQLFNGLWHHIAVTVQPGGNTLFFFDGFVQGLPIPTASPGSLVNTSPLVIGKRITPFGGFYVGDMDELEIFNRPLTALDVLGLATAFPPTSAGKCKHVVRGVGTKFRPDEGAPFTGQVATFTDSLVPPGPPLAYAATINWGGGAIPATSAGVVSGPVGGQFTVTGGPVTYPEGGTYPVGVTISAIGMTPVVVPTVAVVRDVPVTVSCGLPATTWMNFTGTVATFTHTNPLEPSGNAEFVTTINWNDGTPTSTGTVTGSPGPYTVTGSHNFLFTGSATVTIAVTDDTETVSRNCRVQVQGKVFGPFGVPGRADPWLSGLGPGCRASGPPGGTGDCTGPDMAPFQSPVLAWTGPLPAGNFLEFPNVTGTSAIGPGFSTDCDGIQAGPLGAYASLFHTAGAQNGMSNLGAPANSLVGVFLGPNPPITPPATPPTPPALLNFTNVSGSIASGVPPGGGALLSNSLSRTFFTLSPQLTQPFFIGDGYTGIGTVPGTYTGLPQQFFIPAGATRLFLGSMDASNWTDNLFGCTTSVLASDP